MKRTKTLTIKKLKPIQKQKNTENQTLKQIGQLINLTKKESGNDICK